MSFLMKLSRLSCSSFFVFHHNGICMLVSCHLQSLSYDDLVILLQILAQPQELSKQGCILESAIEASATEIINIKDSLNEWDSKVGDGDCGTTVSQIVSTNSMLI